MLASELKNRIDGLWDNFAAGGVVNPLDVIEQITAGLAGLDMKAAKEAFAGYLDETRLGSNQIYFVNQIVEYIVQNGIMKDLSVLQKPPFTDNGSIVKIFTDLSLWFGIKSVIDKINANAVAA